MRTNHKNLLREKTNLFGLFLLISLLLHILIGLGLPNRLFSPKPEISKPPTPIALQKRKNWLELDQKPPKETEAPTNATHIAQADQKVKQETAPKADDSRDQKPTIKQVQRRAESRPRPKTPRPTSPPRPAVKPRRPAPPKPAERYIPPQPEVTPVRPKPPTPIDLPDLKSLVSLSPQTQARIARQQDRPEIELKDDEVWLNLRRDDKLISFFRRFSDRIEAVWNYPTEASEQGIEGTLLIKIVINKKGELLDALPVESSGSDILDYEAIQAIYRAAPFGDLPSYYKHEQLKIFAHFQYHLSRHMIYGNP